MNAVKLENDPDAQQALRIWVDAGMNVGNHTWSHPSFFCFLTPSRLRSEIERGSEAIQRICGYRPCYFRSPVGLRHALLGPYLRDEGLEYLSWRIRTRDTFGPKAGVLVSRIVNKAAAGDIILLPDNSRAGARPMLEAIPQVIDRLRSQGFEFVLPDAVPVAGASTARCAL